MSSHCFSSWGMSEDLKGRGSLQIEGNSYLKPEVIYSNVSDIRQDMVASVVCLYINASFSNGEILWECLVRQPGCCVNTTDTQTMAIIITVQYNLMGPWDKLGQAWTGMSLYSR